jgi:hypothetical protein
MKEDEICGLCGMNEEIRNSGDKTPFGRCRLR